MTVTELAVSLAGLSASRLEALAEKANALASDLRKSEPSYDLAMTAGILDKGYKTVRWGHVASYSGEAEIVMEDGRRWKAIGHGSRGDAEYVSRQGYIEFIPLD